MTSSITRRIERAEAVTASAGDARLYRVRSPEIAEDLWSTARRDGKPGGLYIVQPNQAEPVIVGPTIPDLMQDIAINGRTILDDVRDGRIAERRPDNGSYTWHPPRPDDIRRAH